MSLMQVMSIPGMLDADYPLRSPSRSYMALKGAKRQKVIATNDQFDMSGYYYPTTTAEEEHQLAQAYQPHPMHAQQPLPSYEPIFPAPFPPQSFNEHAEYYTSSTQYPPSQLAPYHEPHEPLPWIQDQIPSNSFNQPIPSSFPRYSESSEYAREPSVVGSSSVPVGYLSPQLAGRGRISRTASFTSNASSAQSVSVVQSDISRSGSPNAGEMAKWGFKNVDGTWSCAFPGCTSRSTFKRGCDLRKHYKRHSKSLFCRHDGCPQATEGGFSSKKDRARHEAKHNPSIVCEWDGCERLFSRQDNMKDHVRRVHKKRMA